MTFTVNHFPKCVTTTAFLMLKLAHNRSPSNDEVAQLALRLRSLKGFPTTVQVSP